jgi:truncated hemoglobin YjbI
MRTALDELALDAAVDAEFWNYLVMAAHSLVNQALRPPGGPDLGLTPA